MIDFEKASMNGLENNFISVINGCFFHLSQYVYRKVQAEGLARNYREDLKFTLKIMILPSLSFLPEMDVINCLIFLLQDFPGSAFNLGKDFISAKDYPLEVEE